MVHFDAERAAERAEDFVAEVLVGCLNARAVIVGHDFHFGHNREGDVPLLQRMGAQMGFDVTGIRLLGRGPLQSARAALRRHRPWAASRWRAAQPISSTRIRRLIAEGDVAGRGRPPRPLVRAARGGGPR